MPYNAWQEFFDKTFPADPKPKARNAVNTKLLRLYALNPISDLNTQAETLEA